jgi:hypothetical protein
MPNILVYRSLQQKAMLNKRYLGAASMMLGELFDAITPEEKQKMKQMFDNIGPDLYEQYRQEVFHDTLAYISAKPEERKLNPKWYEPEYRMKLQYFSFLYLQRGYLFMTRLAKMPNRNGLRRVVAFFSVLAENVCFKKLSDSIFNDELTYIDYN